MNSIKTAMAVSLLCAGAAGFGTATAQAPEPVVLTIGEHHWSPGRFALLRAAGGPPEALGPDELESFVKNFAERHVLARQAEAAGLTRDPRIAEKLALARDRVLAEEERIALQKAAPVDRSVVRAEFDAHPGRFDELRLSHILIRITDQDQALPPAKRRTDAQALARATSIQRQLRAGAHFKTLARKYSEDESSGRDGGELPVIFAKDLKLEVQPVVSALKAQQSSAPVRGPDGYHLIRLEERTVTDFEGARRLLELSLREAWADRQIEKFRADSPVTFDAAAGQAQEDARARGADVSSVRGAAAPIAGPGNAESPRPTAGK